MRRLIGLAIAMSFVVSVSQAQYLCYCRTSAGATNTAEYSEWTSGFSQWATSGSKSTLNTVSTGSRFATMSSSGAASKTCRFTPTGLGAVARKFKIEYTHAAGNAPHIKYNVMTKEGLSADAFYNCTTGNAWADLGSFNLIPGTAYVEFDCRTSDNGTGTWSGGRFYADLMRFTDVGDVPVAVSGFTVE